MRRAARRVAVLGLSVSALGGAAACGEDATHPLARALAGQSRIYGEWYREDDALPTFSLTVRRTAAGDSGRVSLSGVTFALPATVTATRVVLADPVSSALAPVVGELRADGRLHVTYRERRDHSSAVEFVLARAD